MHGDKANDANIDDFYLQPDKLYVTCHYTDYSLLSRYNDLEGVHIILEARTTIASKIRHKKQ